MNGKKRKANSSNTDRRLRKKPRAQEAEQSPIVREKSTTSVEASRQEKSPLKRKHSPVTMGRPKMPIEDSRLEKSLSMPELLTTEQTQTNEANRKKRRINPIRLGPVRQEKSPSNQEQSPAIFQLEKSRDELNHSKQKKISTKEKASKIKRAAPVDNNDLGNGLRRSTRYRVPPLDSWRNQRLVFQTLASGEVQCVGIDEGTEADNFGLRQIARKAEQRKLQKKKSKERRKSRNAVKTSVMNLQTGQSVPVQVHLPFESLRWSAPPNEVEPPPYKLAKAFTSESTSFGFLDISPFSEKKEQFSPTFNLHFVVIKGHLEVTIQRNKFTFNVGDSWIVPTGVPYSIKNCSRARALVSFSTFKE